MTDYGRTVRLGSGQIPADFGHREHPDFYAEEPDEETQELNEHFKALFAEGPPEDPWEDTEND